MKEGKRGSRRGREGGGGAKKESPSLHADDAPKPLALPLALVSHFLNETITAAEAVASLALPLRLSPARRVWNGNIISAMTAATGDTERLGRVTETAGHSLGRQRAGRDETGFAW